MHPTTKQPRPPEKPAKPFPRWSLGGLLLIGLLLASYPFVINRCAFYPDRHNLLPASHLPEGVEELYLQTEDGERLQCYWLPRPEDDRIAIYFHGNAGNIGHRLPELRALADLGLNVLGVGYRGYGQSSGRPTEKGIYADGRAALAYVTAQRGFAREKVFLLGRSIGSTVVVEIAREQRLGGVILVTPLTSGRAMAQAHGFGPLAYFAGARFDNLGKIHQLRAPLLIIHGTADTITPFFMGKTLFERAPAPKQFVTIQGGGHNDIGWTGHAAYWDPIARFVADPAGRSR